MEKDYSELLERIIESYGIRQRYASNISDKIPKGFWRVKESGSTVAMLWEMGRVLGFRTRIKVVNPETKGFRTFDFEYRESMRETIKDLFGNLGCKKVEIAETLGVSRQQFDGMISRETLKLRNLMIALDCMGAELYIVCDNKNVIQKCDGKYTIYKYIPELDGSVKLEDRVTRDCSAKSDTSYSVVYYRNKKPRYPDRGFLISTRINYEDDLLEDLGKDEEGFFIISYSIATLTREDAPNIKPKLRPVELEDAKEFVARHGFGKKNP